MISLLLENRCYIMQTIVWLYVKNAWLTQRGNRPRDFTLSSDALPAILVKINVMLDLFVRGLVDELLCIMFDRKALD